MDEKNPGSNNIDVADPSSKRYKPVKRPTAETDNSLIKMWDSIVKGLEGSLGKRTYLCGNPDCGTLIMFHTSETRPVVCVIDAEQR